ncbi:hypothetical protein LZ30DRAFT_715755 [Colletotrichum cereale]|nr:hypothetical protein LZ30DRAFT_715755 [Colletotrichum cereale]
MLTFKLVSPQNMLFFHPLQQVSGVTYQSFNDHNLGFMDFGSGKHSRSYQYTTWFQPQRKYLVFPFCYFSV